MPATITIREATPADDEAIARVTLAAYDGLGVWDETTPYRRTLADTATRRDSHAQVLVATDTDGRVLGSVTATFSAGPFYEFAHGVHGDCGFRMLAVDPVAAGQGIGARLVDEVLRRARAAGCARMVITSMAWMPTAHRLYERRGFVRRPDLDVTYPSGVGQVFHLDLQDDAPTRFAAPGPVPATPPWFEDRPWYRPEADEPDTACG